jgi:Putative adhesin
MVAPRRGVGAWWWPHEPGDGRPVGAYPRVVATGRGRGVAVAISVLLIVVGGLGLLRAVGGERTTTEVLPSAESVVVTTGSGDVDLVAADRDDVSVRLEARQTWPRQVTLETDESGGTLTLSTECSGVALPLSQCSGNLVVELPPDVAAQVETGSGEVRLGGVTGDVAVQTGSGDIVVSGGTPGRLTLRTGSGDIEVEGLGSSGGTLRTGSGSIEVVAEDEPDELAAETGSGNVLIVLPGDTPYAVDVETGSGEEDVQVATDPDSDHRIVARTGSGDIELRER